MIARDEKTGEYVGMKCDHPGCEVMAPPAAEIQAGHGLINMGWECHGGIHVCPEHARPREEWDHSHAAKITRAQA